MNPIPVSPYAFILAVEGYVAKLSEVRDTVEPLISWEPNNQKSTVRWQSSAFKPYYIGFWVTELAFFYNGTVTHARPGAYVRTVPGTESSKYIDTLWHTIHQKYTYTPDNICLTQYQVRLYLESYMMHDTIIFHKGCSVVASLANLLGVQSINLRYRGLPKIDFNHVNNMQRDGYCTVHRGSLQHCPKAQVNYIMSHFQEWYRPDDFPIGEEDKENEEATAGASATATAATVTDIAMDEDDDDDDDDDEDEDDDEYDDDEPDERCVD